MLTIQEIFTQLVEGIRQTSFLEFVAVITGIASVWFSRIENILVYPVGLINTIIYIFLSINGHLFGEASVNFYYTVMSIYGWILWAKKDQQKKHVVVVTSSSPKEWMQQLFFFAAFYIGLFIALQFLKKTFAPGAIPWADGFASATAYTGMLLMAKKKLENWIWWILTNMASIPLYFYKHAVFTSFQYLVFLILAVMGYLAWKNKLQNEGT